MHGPWIARETGHTPVDDRASDHRAKAARLRSGQSDWSDSTPPTVLTRRTLGIWVVAFGVSFSGMLAILVTGPGNLEFSILAVYAALYGPQIVATVLTLRIAQAPAKRIGLSRVGVGAYLRMIPLAGVVLLGSSALFALQDAFFADAAEGMTFAPRETAVSILLLLVVAPTVEELVARGVLFLGIMPKLSRLHATVVSVVFFSVLHLSLEVFVPFAWVGFVMTRVALKYQSILPCIFLHGVVNATALTVGGAFASW